jgi:O-antigen/teichoic acid export membrane protein
VAGVAVMVGRYRVFLLALGLAVTPAVLAVSHFAFRLLDAALAVVWQTIGRLAMPRLCALQHDREALAEAYGELAHLQALLGLPIAAGIALTTPELVQALLGPAWAGAGAAARVAAAAATLGFLHGDCTALFVAVGKARRNAQVAAASLLMPLLALALLRPQTPEGVALTWAVQSLVLPPVLAWAALRELRRPALWLARRVAPGVAVTAAMAAAVLAVQGATPAVPPLARLLVCAAAGATVFAGAAWLVLCGRLPRALAAPAARAPAVAAG